jgi:Holliday junction DNA helicase RuvA
VGRKTAERVVLELQDKMAALTLTTAGQSRVVVTEDEQVMRDVVSALLNLGYRQNEAEKAVRTARAPQDGNLTLEALLKDALQALAR